MRAKLATIFLLGCTAIAGDTIVAAAQTGNTRAAGLAAGVEPVAVIELYTSQGCSSCPPADALLQKMAERSDVIALTLPVDYWDYLGWKDTLATARNSERQRAYAKKRGDGMVYTPQVVVNGLSHANGAKIGDIEQAIASTAATFKTTRVPIKVSSDRGKLVIETGQRASGPPVDATIWLATVQRHAEVAVRKGENGGKTLSYVNVVRDLTPVGMWSGKSETVQVDPQSVMRNGAEACAVLIQEGKGGPILGAAWLPTATQ